MISPGKPRQMGEVSGPQVPSAGTSALTDPRLTKYLGTLTYKVIDTLRKDATIALTRELMPGPILAANWNFGPSEEYEDLNGEDSVKEEWITFIKNDLMKVRDTFLINSIRGLLDYGWVPYEKVFKKGKDGYIHLHKLKQLVQRYTDIVVDQQTGEFLGFYQEEGFQGVTVPYEKAFLLNEGVEGTNWYGLSKMHAAQTPVEDWNEANAGANQYDRKIAGSHWLIKYPVGETEYDGVATDNYEIAKKVLNSLESSGGIILPNSLSRFVQDMSEEDKGWEVSPISDVSARQYSFVARLQYLDKLKVRAMGYPERAILEGNFGTKAEAGVHASIAAVAQDVRHKAICSAINESIVDQLLIINFGPEAEGAVRLSPSPITDATVTFLQNVYKMFCNSPEVVAQEYNTLDMETFREVIGMPNSGEVGHVLTPEEELELKKSSSIQRDNEDDDDVEDDDGNLITQSGNRYNTNPSS